MQTKENKRNAHNERVIKRKGRTDEEQLLLLNERLGVNQGAKKERWKLLKRIGSTSSKK